MWAVQRSLQAGRFSAIALMRDLDLWIVQKLLPTLENNAGQLTHAVAICERHIIEGAVTRLRAMIRSCTFVSYI